MKHQTITQISAKPQELVAMLADAVKQYVEPKEVERLPDCIASLWLSTSQCCQLVENATGEKWGAHKWKSFADKHRIESQEKGNRLYYLTSAVYEAIKRP